MALVDQLTGDDDARHTSSKLLSKTTGRASEGRAGLARASESKDGATAHGEDQRTLVKNRLSRVSYKFATADSERGVIAQDRTAKDDLGVKDKITNA